MGEDFSHHDQECRKCFPMAQCHTLGCAHLLLRELCRALSSLPELDSHHTVISIGEADIFHKGPQCLDEDKQGIQKYQQREGK